MLIFSLFSWWYTAGWLGVIRSFGTRLIKVSHIFSMPILLRTLFAPWRRIITYPGASIEAKLRAFGDNLVSRVVGFTVRILVLIAASLILLLTAVFSGLWTVLWPLIPIAIPVLLIKGILG